MTRRNFSRAVKVAVVKRCTRDGIVYCEKCGAIAKKFQIDHVIADALGGEPVISNAELICEPCYQVKNPQDTTLAAKVKRIEAKHIGVEMPKVKIPKRTKNEKPKRDKLDMPPRRSLYEVI
jgi:5-methylcytosine-specific restriction endonuclease McrA